MKLITLELQRLALRGADGEIRTRRDDLRTFQTVVDVMDYGKMKRGLLNSFSDLAEELMLMELDENVANGISGWPARDAIGKFTRTVQITPEQLDEIDGHLSAPPQGVTFVGGTFRALILSLRSLKQKYDDGEIDVEETEHSEANEQEEDEEEAEKVRSARQKTDANGESPKKRRTKKPASPEPSTP